MSAAPKSDLSAIKILLYTLITSDNQDSPVYRGVRVSLRGWIRRSLSLAEWRFREKWRATHWVFENVSNDNRGDIAIRLGVRKALEQAFRGRSVTFSEVAWGDLTPGLITTLNAEVDLIVVGGGGYLFTDSTFRLPKRFFADVEALSCAKCPVVAISIGANFLIGVHPPGPVRLHEDQRESIQRFLKHLSIISVRDSVTQDTLRPFSPHPPPVIVDPAFLLAFPSPRVASRPNGAHLRVGINLAFHGHRAAKLSSRVLPMLVRVLKNLGAAMPCHFCYFVHADSERAIVTALRLKGIQIEVVSGTVDQLIAGYRQLDIHLGSMMHSTILAMSVGIPTLALAYDIKSQGFFDLFGLGRLSLNVAVQEDNCLLEAISDLVVQRQEIAAVIDARQKELREEAEAFYGRVAALVNLK